MTDISNRPTITIDECMKMSEQELDAFIENDQQYLSEDLKNETHSNVDFQGMSVKEVAKKYGCKPIDEIFDNIKKCILNDTIA